MACLNKYAQLEKGFKTLTQKILILVAIFLVACSSPEKTPNNLALDEELAQQFPVEVLSFPPSVYFSTTWLSNGNILVSNKEIRYFSLNPTTLSVVEIQFPPDPSCTLKTQFLFPSKLPTNELGFIKECSLKGERDSMRFMVSVDLTALTVDYLIEGPLPNIGGYSFSWNPQMTEGVQVAGSMDSTILLITPEKAKPLDVHIQGWSLAQNYFDMLSRRTNDDLGIARAPGWSPNGQTIAFLASTEAIGRSGFQRIKSRYGLYLMDANDRQPHLILDEIYFPGELEWSPTSQFIAFSGDVGSRSNPGLWVWEVGSSNLIQISDSEISHFSWSPDGKSIVAERDCPEDGCWSPDEITRKVWDQFNTETCTIQDLFCEEIIKIDVSSLVDPSP